MPSNQHEVGRCFRGGFSFVEFIGCIAALGGGLIFGLVYLGFDLKAVAVEAWEYAETSGVVATSEQSADSNSEGTPAHVRQPEPITEEVSTSKKESLKSSEPNLNQGTTLNESAETLTLESAASGSATQIENAEKEPAEATHDYWLSFTKCLKEEAIQRSKIVSNAGDWQLFDYLNHRKIGHEKAVARLEAIDDSNVDHKLRTHAQLVLSWHRAGVKLYGRAVELLTDSTTANLAGPSAQSWQSAATQHRMEEKLVRGKHESVAGYLNHTFKAQAPFTPAFLQ